MSKDIKKVLFSDVLCFFLDSLVEASDPSEHDYTKIDIIKEGRSRQWHN